MTMIFVACKECNPTEIMPVIKKRNLPFSEGQTSVWTCIHVITYKATYPQTFERIK